MRWLMTASIRRALGVAVIAITLGCAQHGSSERSESRDSNTADGGAAPADSDAARARIESLRDRFHVALAPGNGFTRTGALLRPILSNTRATHAAVDVPIAASDRVQLRDARSSLSIAFRLAGARDVDIETSRGRGVYAGALGPGIDLVMRPSTEGIEDFVAFDRAPEREEIAYELTLGANVAGLRLVDGTLEMLDASGAPRLRMAHPWIIDANREVHRASVAVDGCAVDTSPMPPWKRAPLALDSRSCVVRIGWTIDAYPALLDPSWAATGTMAEARIGHSSASLPSGTILVAGGDSPFAVLSSAEYFDPASGTWSAAPSAPAAWILANTSTLADGRVLVTGGNDVTGAITATAQLFTPTTATWIATPNMVSPHQYHTATLLSDGRVLVASGLSLNAGNLIGATEIYDATSGAAGTWTAAAPLPAAVCHGAAALLPDGDVLLAGGDPTGPCDFLPSRGTTAAAYRYHPASDTWAPTASMSFAHSDAGTATLLDGRILVAGGGSSPSSAEIYDGATSTWTTTGYMTEPRAHFEMLTIWNGNVLATGGYKVPSTIQFSYDTELYDPATGRWTAAQPMLDAHLLGAAAPIPSLGKVLISGGTDSDNFTFDHNYLATAEIFSATALGGTCLLGVECLSGYCADGVCCDSQCNGTCVACTAAKKGSGADGTCAPVAAGADPNDSCKDDGSPACMNDGLCDGSGACQIYPQSSGCTPTACTNDAQCTSGHCVEGICCDQACTSPCQSCLAARTGSGANGVCGDVPAGTNPKGGCLPDPGYPQSCKGDGLCDGAGQCRAFAPNGITCGAATCTGDSVTGSLCNGSGVCVQSTASCAPYLCGASNACSTTCNADTDCEPTAFCRVADHTCQPKLALGGTCALDTQCALGHCVDGVCCDTACTGLCAACSAAKNGGSDGTCGFIQAGSDPDGDCPDDGPASCQRDGACDGAGACQVYAKGSACGATACVGNVQTGYACNGSCQSNQSVDCTPFRCVGAACTSSCQSDADCAGSAWCSAGKCVAKTMTGKPCSTGDACDTGFCVDGVCCNSPCTEPCAACDATGAIGQCVPVYGKPHGNRPACAAASGNDPCTESLCNGVDVHTCAGHVGPEVSCRAASCTNGVATLASVCDGQGVCPSAETKTCEPFACGSDACKDTCATDADCTTGYRCSGGKCITGATCDGNHTITGTMGDKLDCAPLKCEPSGVCKMKCASVDDCVTPNVCDESGACVAPPAAASSSDSGGCTSSGHVATRGGWQAVLFGLLAFALIRRRSSTAR
jgi:N-acetylneuraminic acid mutarotase